MKGIKMNFKNPISLKKQKDFKLVVPKDRAISLILCPLAGLIVALAIDHSSLSWREPAVALSFLTLSFLGYVLWYWKVLKYEQSKDEETNQKSFSYPNFFIYLGVIFFGAVTISSYGWVLLWGGLGFILGSGFWVWHRNNGTVFARWYLQNLFLITAYEGVIFGTSIGLRQ